MPEQLLANFNEKSIRELSREQNEPEWLLNFRLLSFQNFVSLPLEKNTLYTKYAYVSQFNLSDYEFFNEDRVPDFKETFQGYLFGNETNITIHANQKNIHTDLQKEFAEKGVKIMNIQQAIKDNEGLLKEIFSSKLVKSEDEKFAAFVNAFFNTGTFIYVPAGLKLDKPLRKLLLTDNPKSSIIDQTVILAGEDSSVSYLEEQYSKLEGDKTLYASNLDVFTGRNSSLDLSSIQCMSENIVSISNKGFGMEEGSKLTNSSLVLGSSILRGRTNFHLRGRGSFGEGFEIFFIENKQRYDFESNLLHSAPDTTGSNHARGVLKGQSQSIFKGMIKITHNAKNSRSYLAHHAMILERSARSDAIPGLEIDTNEVKATHSASVAQLDEEQLFYMMSRGLDREEAKRMIVLGFFEPVLSRIPVEETREGARFVIEGKWAGERRKLADKEMLKRLTGELEHEVRQTEDIFERHYKYR